MVSVLRAAENARRHDDDASTEQQYTDSKKTLSADRRGWGGRGAAQAVRCGGGSASEGCAAVYA